MYVLLSYLLNVRVCIALGLAYDCSWLLITLDVFTCEYTCAI